MGAFGVRLRQLREAAGLTQQQVSDRAGITPDGLSKLERGLRSPGWDVVCRLCDVLGVSCETFREEPATPPEPRRRGRPRKPPTVAPTADAPPTPPERPQGRRRGRTTHDRPAPGRE